MNDNFKSINQYLNFVESKFNECFTDKKYIKKEPVLITSQIDKSVDFVGSKISPLKHYLLENNIPNEGVALIQNCMKLRALKYLKDYSSQTFGSCYRGMGTITKYDLEKIVSDTFDYLLNDKYLGMNPNDLCIRINSSDTDLINSIKQVDCRVKREFDTESEENYKHIYGLDNKQITGRNFNIAVRKGSSNIFFDCAAIIVMESPYEKLAIDMGIGNSSLAMCYYNTDNTVASSRMGDVVKIDSVEMMKFADSMIAVSTLLYENITEHPSKHFRKKFRQYLQALRFWREELGITDENILSYMNRYLNLEYDCENFITEKKYNKVLNYK